MKALFQIDSAGRAYAWLLGLAVVRSILDYFWVPIFSGWQYKIAVLFNYTVYLFTLYLLIPAIAGFILRIVFSKPVDHSAVLRESVLVWIVYPAVTVISLTMKSPPMRSIEWFRNIPTFLVDNNFLPAGMIAVIPVLIVFYTWLLMRHSGADWLRALAAVLVSLWVVYLVYYQYALRLFLYFHGVYGLYFSAGFFTLAFLIPLLPIAGRFHEAFGPHRVMLPRLVLVATFICLGLMAVGLLQAVVPGAQAQSVLSVTPPTVPPSSVPQSTVHWNLRFFQLYDPTDAMAAYGFFLDSNVAGRSIRRVRLFRAGSVFEDVTYVTSGPDRLSYGDMLDIGIEESELTFDWNRASAGGDPFLETFQGTDVITKCTARLAGENCRCFLLDENLSADVSKLGSWAGETFLALAGDDVALIAFAYDDYTDGVIALGNDRRRVTQVSRQGWVISISFENGSADANCSPLAQYETLVGLSRQPVDSPIRCELEVRTNVTSPITTRVDGLLEWIGQTQGE